MNDDQPPSIDFLFKYVDIISEHNSELLSQLSQTMKIAVDLRRKVDELQKQLEENA